jgi:outer membrane receptor protein involved in Fe transport
LTAPAGAATFNTASIIGSTTWLISPTTRYAQNCQGPCTPGALVIPNMAAASLNVPLTPGNTQVLDRLNQLDLSVSKSFHTGTKRLQARFDVFNSLNKAPVLVVRSSNFGTAAYLQPSSVLDGRTFRVGMQMQF